MSEAVKLLSKVTGVGVGELKTLWQDAKDNVDRLHGCARHRFDVPFNAVQPGKRFTCLECGGVMNLSDIGTYIRGYVAAGGAADDIWPGWTR